MLNLSDLSRLTRSQFETECQAGTDHIYLGDNLVLCRVLGGRKLYTDSRDLSVAPHLIMDGFWESWISLFFSKIIRPGFVCLDVGANYGYYSILMSELAGPTGKTLAIEANPEVTEYLRSTCMLNGNSFDVIEKAISNKRGEVTLTVTDKQLGGSTIIEQEASPGTHQVKVPAITLDELAREQRLERIDFLKIDVEGVEPFVLEGMKEIIANNPGIQMIIEYSPCMYSDAGGYTDFLFSNFSVCEVQYDSTCKALSEKDIPSLLAIPGHTDLFLKKRK